MESELTLPTELRDQLIALEDELDRSIRLLGWSRVNEAAADHSDITVFSGGPFAASFRNITLEDGVTLYDAVIPASPAEAPITCGEEVVGEIHPNKVYLYGYAPNYSSDLLMPLVIEAARACVDEDFAAQQAEQQETQRREALIRFSQSQYDSQLANHRAQISSFQRSITEYEQGITDYGRQLRQTQELLDAVLQLRDNGSSDRLLEQYDALAAHPRVASIEFANNAIHIVTTDDLRLTREDTNESRWLGAFDVKIALDTYAITLANLNTRRGGRDHPHIEDGKPCFGDHAGTFRELLLRGDLYLAFEYTLQFIETLNLRDSWGSYGSYWFEVPDERPLEVAVAA